MKSITITLLLLLCASMANAATSISRNNITWTFDADYTVGQFVSGDWYVVDPGGGVTINSVSPAPNSGANGTMINPTINGKQALDSVAGGYDAGLLSTFPLSVSGGDAVLSSISRDGSETADWTGRSGILDTHVDVREAEILTVLSAVPSAGSFRPSYLDRSQVMHNVSEVDVSILPKLPMVATPPTHAGFGTVEYFERGFNRPWMIFANDWLSREINPLQNQIAYHRHQGEFISEAMTLMLTDQPGMDTFVTYFVQTFLDYYFMITQDAAGSTGYAGTTETWIAPIILTGLLLNDSDIYNVQVDGRFDSLSRDFEKFYYYADRTSLLTSAIVPAGETWTGATVFFRKELDNAEYEHMDPTEWGQTDMSTAEDYRSCCDSYPHVGMALTGRIMGFVDKWDHAATFDYTDRWMTEPDSVYTDRGMTPLTNMRSAGTDFINEMWDTYRNMEQNTFKLRLSGNIKMSGVSM